jgi:long-chain fatty acid transport protein
MWFSPSGRVFPLLSAVFLFFLLGSFSTHNLVRGQGFGVYEQGTCVMARAGATVAQGCGDGSSIYFNPANIVGTEGTTVSIGATLIDAHGGFNYDYTSRPPYTGVEVELENDPIPAPHLYITYGVNENLAVGLGTYVPYGLETVWPVKLENGNFFDGAFEGYDNSVQAVYVQPTVAYHISDRLTVGGGPVLAISNVELNQVADLAGVEVSDPEAPESEPDTTLGELGVPHHTAFAKSTLEGSGAIGYGANLGVSYQVTDRLRLGLRGTLPITISYEGEATFEPVNQERLKDLVFVPPSPLARDTDGDGNPDTPVSANQLVSSRFQDGGTLTTQDVETELTFPAQIVAGLSFQATDRLLLLADYQYTRWSSFDEIAIDFEKAPDQTRKENYNDTHAIRLGGAYDLTKELTVQAGYLFNTPAAPDEVVTPLLPEAQRNQVTVGLGWRPVDLLEIHAAYQLLLQNDRRGRVRGAPLGQDPTTDLNNGLYEFGANLFGTTLTLHL